jgi:hypothetical protein
VQTTIDVHGVSYRIHPTDDDTLAYYLRGPRATYGLFRSENGYLFPVNSNGRVCDIRGENWFSDRAGEIKPVKLL